MYAELPSLGPGDSMPGVSPSIGYIGSCLSSDPISHLMAHYGFVEEFRVARNRSDAFRGYFVDRTWPLPDVQKLQALLKLSSDPSLASNSRDFLDNQVLPTIGFGATLKCRRGGPDLFNVLAERRVDVILLDNFMDIAAKLMTPTERSPFQGAPLFINPHFYDNEEELHALFRFTDFLTARESAANWLAIYRWLKAQQPQAKFIFLCFPYATSRKVEERHKRAYTFYEEFRHLARGEDIDIIPPLHIADEWTNGDEDWYHIKPEFYSALAGYVFLRAIANFPKLGSNYQEHLTEPLPWATPTLAEAS
jgi:hypothetical protein